MNGAILVRLLNLLRDIISLGRVNLLLFTEIK